MNKTILITGGTGKIGSQLVKYFTQNKHPVIIISNNQSDITNLINQCHSNKSLIGFELDLLTENPAQKTLNFLEKENLFPEVLIHCARNLNFLKIGADGITQRQEFLGELTLDVIVPYEISMILANQTNSKLKNIINISSIYGIVPPNPNLYKNPIQDSPIQYGVAKASQIHLTKELAIRLASKKIQVNSISYGGIEGRVDEEFKKKYAQLCPMGKMLKEEEVIGAVDFLVSNKSNYITGHNLVVDGGWSVW